MADTPPDDTLSGDKLAMLALALRKQFSPTWDSTPLSGNQNQTSQSGMSNMMMPMAKALMMKGGPKTYSMEGLPDGAFADTPTYGNMGSLGGQSGGLGQYGSFGTAGSNGLGGGLTEFGSGDLSALSGGSGAGGGAGSGAAGGMGALGGAAVGVGSLAALTAFNNYFRQNHEMTPQDYMKQWGGQSYAAAARAAAAHAAGNTAEEQHYTALANTTKGLSNLTGSALAGNYVPDVTTTRDPGYQRNAKPF
jgi:hypothetical protein